MRKFSFIFSVALTVLAAGFFSCSNKSDDNNSPKTIAGLAQSNPQLTILVKALQKAGLVSVLDGTDKYTVFAPTNSAMTAAGITEASIETTSADALKTVLLYHVLPGEKLAASLQTGIQTTATDASFKNMRISVSAGKVKINGYSTVTTADVKATNGVVHIIDAALSVPSSLVEEISKNKDYSLFLAAITESGLLKFVSDLTAGTCFAPNNNAFKAIGINSAQDFKTLLNEELTLLVAYHFWFSTVYSNELSSGPRQISDVGQLFVSVTDKGVFLNGEAKVTNVDYFARNGTIHAIDKVLSPAKSSITQIVVASANASTEEFSLLLRAIQRVEGLADILDGTSNADNYTVFAPTDAAFRAAGLTVAVIDETDVNVLADLLKYHVISGAVFSTDIKAGSVPTLVKDKNLTISVSSGVKVNDSNVTKTNILATNGVIHVIDKVLSLK
jgi:transforming growth factor-beta-induced protein